MYMALELKVMKTIAQRQKEATINNNPTSSPSPNVTLDEFKLLLDGFLHTLRGSQGMFKSLKAEFLLYLPQLSTADVAKIVKSLFLIEYEDKEIF